VGSVEVLAASFIPLSFILASARLFSAHAQILMVRMDGQQHDLARLILVPQLVGHEANDHFVNLRDPDYGLGPIPADACDS